MFCIKFCCNRIATILLQNRQNPIGINSDSLHVTSFSCSWWPSDYSHVQPNVKLLLGSEWWSLTQNQAFRNIHNLMAFLSEDTVILQLTLWDWYAKKLPLHSEMMPKFPESLECPSYFQTSTNKLTVAKKNASERCNNFFNLSGMQGSIQVPASPELDLPARLLQADLEEVIPVLSISSVPAGRGWFAWHYSPSFPAEWISAQERALLLAAGMQHSLMIQRMWSTKREMLSQTGLILIPW